MMVTTPAVSTNGVTSSAGDGTTTEAVTRRRLKFGSDGGAEGVTVTDWPAATVALPYVPRVGGGSGATTRLNEADEVSPALFVTSRLIGCAPCTALQPAVPIAVRIPPTLLMVNATSEGAA